MSGNPPHSGACAELGEAWILSTAPMVDKREAGGCGSLAPVRAYSSDPVAGAFGGLGKVSQWPRCPPVWPKKLASGHHSQIQSRLASEKNRSASQRHGRSEASSRPLVIRSKASGAGLKQLPGRRCSPGNSGARAITGWLQAKPGTMQIFCEEE